jgi:CheY-like chemotaxis protein
VTEDNPAKTVLVVEDEPDMRIFLSNLLEGSGYCPICAVSLSDGLKKALNACPDLIIINAMLPGEGGIRLYQHLRTSDRLCHVPVLMLSTLDSSTFYRCPWTRRSPAGRPVPKPEAFLQKPPEADELLAIVDQLCSTCSTDLNDPA